MGKIRKIIDLNACCAVVFLAVIALHAVQAQAQTVTFAASELVRSSDTTATVAVVANSAITARVKYGTQTGVYPNETDSITAAANSPLRVVIGRLSANTQYYYRVSYHASGSATWTDRPEYSFHTQRPAGTQFVFDITADDHLNGVASAMYNQTIGCAAADHPDFLFDLGDWYTNNYFNTQGGADTNALFMRTSLLPVSPSSPVYLVNGNHEHEEGWFLTPNWATFKNVPMYSANARIKYFLNPAPNAFYSGDDSTYTGIGIIEGGHRASYYSFVWGNALFVAIDPFFYTSKKPYNFAGQPGEPITTGDTNRWDWTLGTAQYNWLRNTLHNSTQKYKFVFSHQVTGGMAGTCNPDYGRGGVEAIDQGFEWGGGTNWNQAGSAWSVNRPGWNYGPIHQVFKDNGVTIFFHGHDHLFVYETRDGIVYQESPCPTTNLGAECPTNYNDSGATQILNPGYLRVTVSSSNTKVEYVQNTCSTAESYTVQPATAVSPSSSIPTQPFLSLKNGELSYTLDHESPVEMRIYDLLGKKIFEMNRQELPGSYTFSIKSLNLPVQSYIVHFKAGTAQEKRIEVNEKVTQ